MRRFSRHYKASFELIRDPLLVVDTSGNIRGSNAAARTALDIGESRHIRDVVSLETSFVFDPEQMLSLVGRSAPVCGHCLKDGQGNEADVVVDILDLNVGRGKSRIKLIHIKDYSPHENYERWKDELISMMAHEIKNPLFAMKNSMNVLGSQASGAMTEGQRKLLTVSTRSIDRLTRLVDNVLDVSRISSGSYVPEPSWVDAEDFLSEVINTFKTLFNVHRQRLEFTVSEEVGRIFVDAPKLEQILINLLSNAIKFTQEGGEVRVSVERSSLEALSDELRIIPWKDISELGFVRIVVKDTGIGMSEDTLGHLFTRYYKKSDAGGGFKGSHLGLSISKTLVDVQNGRLEFESELGVGTKASLSLPSDEKTFLLLRRVKSIERVLARLANYQEGVVFYAIRKDDSRSWKSLANNWPTMPHVNPTIDEEKEGGFFLWELSDRIALSLVVEPEPRLGTLFGAIELAYDNHAEHTDGFVITSGRLDANETRVSKLLTLAVRQNIQKVEVT
ncbi:MAG: HAMP domain-containing histidine kinase [Candidatus Latescibacterota bacterium]|nr:MAG: HAMP domain-containing histidine kinase [Candidatus Latescibacterota bacterium]